MSAADPALATRILCSTFACDEEVALVVAAKAHFEIYPARSALMSGRSRDERLFVLIDGHARMLAYSMDGRLVVIEDYFAGDLFGEGALSGEVASADEVSAVARTEAGVIPAPAMIGLMGQYSVIAMAISRRLIARIGTLTRRLVEGSTLSATGRVHAELLRLARMGDGTRISPAPVNAQLALRISSTRETVSRTINALLGRGILRRDGDDLLVLSPHRLEELVF